VDLNVILCYTEDHHITIGYGPTLTLPLRNICLGGDSEAVD